MRAMTAAGRPADGADMTSRSCPAGAAETVLPADLPGPVRRLGVFAAAGGAALVLFAVILGVGSDSVDRVAADLLTPAAAAAAALGCWAAAARQHERLRAFWVALGLACVSWTLAEATWAWYELVLDREVPMPSWADVGYLGAVPAVVAALLRHPTSRRSRAAGSRLVLDGLAVAVSLTLLTWSFALGPIWADNDLATVGGVVAVAYPFTDVVLVFLVVRSIVRADGRDRVPLWFVLVGLLAMSLADSAYTYLAAEGQFESGGLLDVGWVAGYVAIALGAYAASHEDGDVAQQPEPEGASLTAAVAPYVPVLIALLVLPAQLSEGEGLAGPVWVLALVLVLLVLVRQSLVAVDRQRDREEVGA